MDDDAQLEDLLAEQDQLIADALASGITMEDLDEALQEDLPIFHVDAGWPRKP